jgi:hypothetical protein
MNLAMVDTCYAYYLNNNIEEIRKKAADPAVTLSAYKKFVHSVVRKAKAYPAQQNFIHNVYEKTDKQSIMIYCIRAINKAARPCEWKIGGYKNDYRRKA